VCLATKMATQLGSSFSDLKCRNCDSRVRGPKYGRASPPRSSFTNGRRERKTGFCS
jgi:hypothetical protein